MNTALGGRMRALRKSKGYTLEKLAELADSSKGYIWELENKNPPRPSAEQGRAKIAAALGVTADFLTSTTASSSRSRTRPTTAFFRKYRSMDPCDEGQDPPHGRA